MARSQLWTHTALLHPSSRLPPPCTCLPSHRSTPVRLFPPPYRCLLIPMYTASPRSASPPCSSHSSAVFLSRLCFPSVRSCLCRLARPPSVPSTSPLPLLSFSLLAHTFPVSSNQGARLASSPSSSLTTSASPSCAYQGYCTPHWRILAP